MIHINGKMTMHFFDLYTLSLLCVHVNILHLNTSYQKYKVTMIL